MCTAKGAPALANATQPRDAYGLCALRPSRLPVPANRIDCRARISLKNFVGRLAFGVRQFGLRFARRLAQAFTSATPKPTSACDLCSSVVSAELARPLRQLDDPDNWRRETAAKEQFL